jgi:hypothetical protein
MGAPKKKRTLAKSDGALPGTIQPGEVARTSAPAAAGPFGGREGNAHARKMDRHDAQVWAERAAFQRFSYADEDAPKTLFRLIADALGDTDQGDLEGSALRTLADDLYALHQAITDECGFICDHRMDLARLPLMLWRLANRARAAAEIAARDMEVLRLEHARAEQAREPKEVA